MTHNLGLELALMGIKLRLIGGYKARHPGMLHRSPTPSHARGFVAGIVMNGPKAGITRSRQVRRQIERLVWAS